MIARLSVETCHIALVFRKIVSISRVWLGLQGDTGVLTMPGTDLGGLKRVADRFRRDAVDLVVNYRIQPTRGPLDLALVTVNCFTSRTRHRPASRMWVRSSHVLARSAPSECKPCRASDRCR